MCSDRATFLVVTLHIDFSFQGSIVKLSVISSTSGEEKEVMLTRMATTAIADNVRMFEIFTALKDRAMQDRDDGAVAYVDDCISLSAPFPSTMSSCELCCLLFIRK
jgi:hypothetical protein